jgi:hypothetical protein
MKILIILFCIASCSLKVSSQSYHPVIEDDKVWLESFNMGVNICNYESVYQLRFGGDTLINEFTYRKILSRTYSPVSAGPYCPPFVLNQNWFELDYVFMREDTTARKVFIWTLGDNPDGEEVLLYDFNLQVGDTIPASGYVTGGIDCVIYSIEDFLLLNGEVRKKYHYSGLDSYYIESIGGSSGLFQRFWQGFGFWWQTMCVEQNGVDLHSPGGGNIICNWLSLGTDEESFPEVSIYPNPSSGNFVLEIGTSEFGNSNVKLNIFNAMGQQIFSEPIQSARNSIQLPPISGIYFWQLQNHANTVKFGKIMVN